MVDNLHMAISLRMVNSLHMANPQKVNSPRGDKVNSLGDRVVVWMDMQNRQLC